MYIDNTVTFKIQGEVTLGLYVVEDEWGPREQEEIRQRALEADRRRREELKHRKKKLGEGQRTRHIVIRLNDLENRYHI